MIFDPRLIFISIWSFEILAQYLFGGIFGSFSNTTWVVVAITIFSFLLGAQFIDLTINDTVIKKNYLVSQIECFFEKEVSVGFIYTTLVIFMMAAFVAIHELLTITDVDNSVLRPFECLRLQIIIDLISDREIAPIIKFFTFGIAACIFYLSRVKNNSKFQIYLIMVLGIFCVLSTTGRLMLLMLFCAAAYLLYVQKVWGIKEIIFSIVCFIFLFFMIAIILNKQTADWTNNIKPCESRLCIVQNNTLKYKSLTASEPITLSNRLTWNAQSYFLSSLAAFNHFVITGSPNIEDGATLPNVIRKVINLTGTNIKMRPAVNPYVTTPLQSNTYTAMYPIYHDLGKVGVLVWFLMLGMLHQFLFKLSQCSQANIYKYLYAISIYPLCMIIFEEAYISSLGFWAIFLITPVLIQLLNIGWGKLAMFKINK